MYISPLNMKLILLVDCSGVWFFYCLLKNIFHWKFVIHSDGSMMPGCLSTVGNSGEKLLCANLCYLYLIALQ